MAAGVVIRLDTASCVVFAEGRAIRCTLPGKWRLARGGQTRPIAAGDRVQFSEPPTGEGVIERVEPRHGGKLARRAAGDRDVEQVVAANVDQLVAVMAVADPPLNRGLLDRLIVSGEHGELAVVVCINKVDLVDADLRFATCDLLSQGEPPEPQSAIEGVAHAVAEVEGLLGLYRRLGYAALATSATRGVGVAELREVLRGKTSVFAGPSGVGKSALLMAVQPGLELKVEPVSSATGKGRHTTTAVSLLPLEGGGFVVDTPGIREFALYDMERDELKHYFPEMAERFGQCRFADCAHLREPGCAVVAAVEAGQIDPGRYESYCRIYESLPAPDPARRAASARRGEPGEARRKR